MAIWSCCAPEKRNTPWANWPPDDGLTCHPASSLVNAYSCFGLFEDKPLVNLLYFGIMRKFYFS
ncbi:MAG: hypothetical protein AMXMBFR75_15040 [Candidatus Hinthialibacteria bacterium]